ncbi:methyl-accepting chemotaxis protein [Neiella sp. HB171785]|uniref:Methyl-accepting chemotaxis protein n=1 Tax=Neiella litorisoli TaxID=2771431 RepID=A0A8J6QVA7_9GAMM|nr:methyl-accepting chemotaxis protein [Neiella litorisoli]MBD1390223.1 methyl-accepting chemotaxis protein [Neiella litorisoli]
MNLSYFLATVPANHSLPADTAMRVSHYSRFSTITLFSVSLAFMAMLYWAKGQLNGASEQRTTYQTIKEAASLGVVASLQNYLLTGDAVLLVEVEQRLRKLEQDLATLPPSISAPISEQVNLLLQKTQSDYRAIGKLSGDPMALLKNAEREMLSSSKSLIRYAADGYDNNPNAARQFTDISADVASLLHELSDARQDLFNSQPQARQHIATLVNNLAELSRRIQALPLLGVYLEVEQDEFALGDDDEAAEEVGELAVAELASLIKRYPGELQQTQQLADQREQSLQALAQDMQRFGDEVAKGEAVVAAEREAMLDRLQLVVGALVAILLLIAIVNYLLQFHYVLKPLRQLREGFKQLLESDELTTIDIRNKRSEMGEIAAYFNQLIEQEMADMKRRQDQLQVVSNALESISGQVNHICRSNNDTEQQLLGSREVTSALAEITTELSRISAEVETNARETEAAMTHSQTDVAQVIAASEQTAVATEQGLTSLRDLTASVSDVSAILDVIRTIAEQTNLLALNAAIESARAGEHGRGFAVVADEVRGLAMKTQNSLGEITQILETLGQASTSLEGNINEVRTASSNQKQIAQQLLDTSESVREKSQQAVSVAHQANNFVQQQEQQVSLFNHAMDTVQQQVEGARGLAEEIQTDVRTQASHITRTLIETEADNDDYHQTRRAS